jgi:MFS family permease
MNDRQPEDFQKPVPLGEPELGELTPPKARITTFTSLKNRNYRWYWLGMLGSFAGLQMNIAARGWLVWEMTESELAIGIVMFAFGVPILLFAIFGGAIADRVNKRNLLIATQAFMAFLVAIIAILITLNMIEFWHLVAVAVCTGFAFVLNGPARQSIIPELVKKRELLNAISLNATGMNLMRVIALALGGALIPIIGIDGVYYAIVVCYILGAVSLFKVSLPQRAATPVPAPAMANPIGRLRNFRPDSIVQFLRSMWPDIKEGVIYIRHSRLVISLLAMAFVPLTFGLPYMFLMPVFADEVLGQSELGYGLLMAMAGVGALVASLAIASLGDFRQKGKLLLASALVFGITLALFGISHSFPLSLAILVGVGAGGTGYMALNNTLLMSNVPLRILGRVMSIWMITFALRPMGTLPIGAVAQALGPTIAVAGGAIIIVLFTLGMIIFVPFLRRLE